MADNLKINELHHLEALNNNALSNLNGGVSVRVLTGVFFPSPKINPTIPSLDASLGVGLVGGGSIDGGVFPSLSFGSAFI